MLESRKGKSMKIGMYSKEERGEGIGAQTRLLEGEQKLKMSW